MRRWALPAIGLCAFVITLVVTAPATLVDAVLRRASDGRLRMAEAQGTVWSGSGQIEIRDEGGKNGIARRLAWRLLPESLLRGHLVCELSLAPSAGRFPVTLSWSGVEVENARLILPASALGLAEAKLVPLGLGGEVLIHTSRLSIARRSIDGTATLQWRGAGSNLTSVSPLGDYELRLDGAGATVHAYLRTIEGPLRLDGKGSWTQGNRPAFAAMAQVAPQHQQALGPLLRLIAVDRGEGRFELLLN
jgi:general secretion pathway protein N